MNAPCLRDLATYLGVPPPGLADELRIRFEAVVDAASRVPSVAPSEALEVHADLDAFAGFIAAVRLDLPVPFLPVPGSDDATAPPETPSPGRQLR